ncbi:hypothetical protein KIH86_17945 [Paenibacillus sp. HN-1]|uniref:hypothetical protein n=1 Tax=Paenibacillus TaxID=44249 RepID=UPI001CA80195|nr:MULTISPECIES: hypothetical protein [Paenibacillus]MBY9078248.1 hypothetical protein [Paenibacillus sp. CGMCC 1.18879]MBY9086093.1 hypothetical protein [Paenibacillus sinensis]
MTAVSTKVSFGYSVVDITPAGQVELVGFDRVSNMSRGILHNLLAQIEAVSLKWSECKSLM